MIASINQFVLYGMKREPHFKVEHCKGALEYIMAHVNCLNTLLVRDGVEVESTQDILNLMFDGSVTWYWSVKRNGGIEWKFTITGHPLIDTDYENRANWNLDSA